MTTSSYQTLTRYQDDRRSNRISHIRQQLRADIYSFRSKTKLALLFKNRQIIDDPIDDCEPEEAYEFDYDHGENNFNPFYTNDDIYFQSLWLDPMQLPSQTQLPSSNSTSPSLSDDSNHCTHKLNLNLNSFSTRNNGKLANGPRLARSRKQVLEYRKRVRISSYSSESILSEYVALKQSIDECTDQRVIQLIICSRWNILANIISSHIEKLSKDALNFLMHLIQQGLIRITDILSILQHGLILTIKDSISRLGSHQADCVALLINIVHTEPRAASYMIELIADTNIIEILEDFIEFGTNEEALLATEFYSCLFNIEISFIHLGNYTPIVPETLSMTNTATNLAKTYCPALSMKRIIRPSFVSALINRFYEPMRDVREELFMMTNTIITHSMEMLYINLCTRTEDLNWVQSVMTKFEIYGFDQILMNLVQTHNKNQHSIKRTNNLNNLLSSYYTVTAKLANRINTFTSIERE